MAAPVARERDDADRAYIAERRGEHNRLGQGVQLGTVRYLARLA